MTKLCSATTRPSHPLVALVVSSYFPFFPPSLVSFFSAAALLELFAESSKPAYSSRLPPTPSKHSSVIRLLLVLFFHRYPLLQLTFSLCMSSLKKCLKQAKLFIETNDPESALDYISDALEFDPDNNFA